MSVNCELWLDGTEAVALIWLCVSVPECACLCGLAVEGGSCWAAGGEVMGRMKSRSKRRSQQDIKVFVFFTHATSLYKEGLYLGAQPFDKPSRSKWNHLNWTSALVLVCKHQFCDVVMLTCCWSVEKKLCVPVLLYLFSHVLSVTFPHLLSLIK